MSAFLRLPPNSTLWPFRHTKSLLPIAFQARPEALADLSILGIVLAEVMSMCGIAGLLSLAGKPVSEAEVQSMCDAMVHRGPNDDGYYAGSDIVLGMRRLSIIDLDGGRQPVRNEDGTIWVVFNGEIYNFKTLRKLLERQGHRFYTDTDTEVIVHLYEQYGEACVDKMRGMFAFAL